MIYHIIETSCYQRLTNGLAIPNLAKRLNIECKTYTINEFINNQIDLDTSKQAIFFTESAFFRNDNNFTLFDLRKKIPNGRIINIGSDSVVFNLQGKDEIVGVDNVDIWLDVNQFSVDYYQNKGINAKLFKWTISEKYIEQIENLQSNFSLNKNKDYVCLARLNSSYRKRLKQFLDNDNYTGNFGTGLLSSELENLADLYGSSSVCIGTTSPAGNDNVRTMKGFRDWIAPFFGTVLIYDNHPEMMWANSVLPYYDYYNLNSLKEMINKIKSFNDYNYHNLAAVQKEFIKKHTIEQQLLEIIK